MLYKYLNNDAVLLSNFKYFEISILGQEFDLKLANFQNCKSRNDAWDNATETGSTPTASKLCCSFQGTSGTTGSTFVKQEWRSFQVHLQISLHTRLFFYSRVTSFLYIHWQLSAFTKKILGKSYKSCINLFFFLN